MRLPRSLSFAAAVLGAGWLLMFLTGCVVTGPADAFRPPFGPLADHSWQIRRFEGLGEQAMLSACGAALQDLGFTIEDTDSKLGLIIGSKDRTARKQQTRAQAITETTLKVAAAVTMLMLTGQGFIPGEAEEPERQVIRTSLFVQPDASGRRNTFTVRLALQRIVYNRQSIILSAETMTDAVLAQAFFDALSKSTFLQAQQT